MNKFVAELVERHPVLNGCADEIAAACDALIAAYSAGNKLFCCGNGGSHSDADHITGELLKGFLSCRRLSAQLLDSFVDKGGEEGRKIALQLQMGLPAITLGSHHALYTSFANDVDADLAYAQELLALGKHGDMLLAISTSGNSRNVYPALIAARALGIKSLLLTGNRHGKCEKYSDIIIAVPESETFKIQELHLPVYHALRACVEDYFYGEKE